MNSMLPGYAFNLEPDRFDTHVKAAFDTTKAARHMRDRLIAQVREGRFDHMMLRRLPGLEGLSDAANEKAALNIIDFHFEPLVLKSMMAAQVAAYFQAVEKTLRIGEVNGLNGEGPLWVDTVHHACVFSVMFQLAAYIARGGYRRLVLLHQGQRPEPRLGIMGGLLRQIPGVQPVFLQLHGNWFQNLARMTTPDTAIFYLTDMPVEAFQRTGPRDKNLSRVTLYAAPDIAIGLNTLSGSSVFARRLKATHLVVEYPAPDHVRVRRFDPASPVTLCPLQDWVFWPLMGVNAQARLAETPGAEPAAS